MGREIKRVPLSFDYPIGKIWIGFQNPYYSASKCEHCDGSGYSDGAKWLHDQWYGYVTFSPSETGSTPLTVATPAIRALAERNVKASPDYYGGGEASIVREAQRLASIFNKQWLYHLEQVDVDELIAANRLWDFKNIGIEHPTAQQVNEWAVRVIGHDSINAHVCIKAKCARLGWTYSCSHCGGSGEIWDSQAEKALYEAWEKIEPPTGEGWQLWETVSEGSPVSPVFATSDELVSWMSENGYSESGARAFVEQGGWAPSFVMFNGEVLSGVDASDKDNFE